MPIHDWSKIPSGLFHDFHQGWSIHIKEALNRGLLPKGLSAMVEQRAGTKEGDVLTVSSGSRVKRPDFGGSGAATMDRPVTRIVRKSTKEIYATRANRIVVKHNLGRIVAVIEIVSPGNKHSGLAFKEFVNKAVDFLRVGVHLLVIDLFPPSTRDPQGIHQAIWDEFDGGDTEQIAGKNRILVSYDADEEPTAFVEPIAVGDVLPSMPLFLAEGEHVFVPLEATYQRAWDGSTEVMRAAIETGVMPEFE